MLAIVRPDGAIILAAERASDERALTTLSQAERIRLDPDIRWVDAAGTVLVRTGQVKIVREDG
jgi:hypothetical protein